MKIGNPFRPTRFENDTHPIIWISRYARELEDPGNFYIAGARGTGKTTLLNSLNWNARQTNETLQVQISDPFERCIGVYFRLPSHLCKALSSVAWGNGAAPGEEIQLSFALFSRFIECTALEAIVEAVVALRKAGIFNFTPDDENAAIARAFTKASFLFRFTQFGQNGDLTSPKSVPAAGVAVDRSANIVRQFVSKHPQALRLEGLGCALADYREALYKAAARSLVTELQEEVAGHEPGQALSDLAKELSKLLRPDGTLYFKFCVDEAEVLDRTQQLFLNTLVRNAKAPVNWAVSFVPDEFDTTRTISEVHHLTSDDRKVLDLSELTADDFKNLCRSVASYRIARALKTLGNFATLQEALSQHPFDIESKLGKFAINDLIVNARGDNVHHRWTQLEREAEALRSLLQASAPKAKPALRTMRRFFGGPNDPLPYYQAFLLSRLHGPISADNSELKQKLRNSGFWAGLRRKQRAALLQICAETRIQKLPYFGWNVVVGLSDNCIRDFIELVASIYDTWSHDRRDEDDTAVLQYFVSAAAVPPDRQRTAIDRSSTTKFDGIVTKLDDRSVDLQRLVRFLGELTHALQTETANDQAIRYPERGVFVLEPPRQDGTETAESARLRCTRVLSRALHDGLILRAGGDVISDAMEQSHSGWQVIRLHARFAPRFGFSFQGAYAPFLLRPELISAALDTDNDRTIKRLVKEAIVERVGADQLDLPFDLPEADDE